MRLEVTSLLLNKWRTRRVKNKDTGTSTINKTEKMFTDISAARKHAPPQIHFG